MRARVPSAVAAATVAALLTTTLGTTAAAAAPAPAGPKVPGTATGVSLRPGDSLRPDGTRQLAGLGLPTGARTSSSYTLVVQDDGNLVEYATSQGATRAVWQTGTAGAATPVSLVFQQDGNVVLYDARNTPLWSTGTHGTAAAYFDVYGNGQLVTQDAAGRVLAAAGPAETPLPGFVVDGSEILDSSTSHYVQVQSDGNVVEYRITFGGAAPGGSATPSIVDVKALWSTGTSGAGQVRLVAQNDGNLVLYQLSTGRAIWQSGTRGPVGYYQFDAQDDGNVVLYRTDGVTRTAAVWASGTFG